MQCPKCQFENREGVDFCEECGTKFEIECPACKAKIPLGRKFCGKCGYALSEFTEAASLKEIEDDTQILEPPPEETVATEIATEGERGPPRRQCLYQQLLDAVATHRVADRPDRFEPRQRKRRQKKYDRMMKPRHELKHDILNRLR